MGFLLEAPKDAGRAGGIAPIIVSTLWIVALRMATALPVGVGTAAFLAEYTDDRGGFGRLVRRCLDALSSVPSIDFGLFGSELFCIYLKMGFSILSGGLTLAYQSVVEVELVSSRALRVQIWCRRAKSMPCHRCEVSVPKMGPDRRNPLGTRGPKDPLFVSRRRR